VKTFVNINGKIYSKEEAKISVFDRAVLYGDGVYETLRSYAGKIFLFEEHYTRLLASLKSLYIHFPLSKEELFKEMEKTIDATGCSDTMIRLIISRGISSINLNPAESKSHTLIIIVEPYKPFPKELYEKGASLIISTIRRNSPMSLNPSIKSLNLLNNFLAYKEAIENKAFDALFLSVDGYIAEGTTFNVFWVKNGQLYTSADEVGILLGTTRQVIIDLASKEHIKINKGFYRREDLLNADECFITSTLKEVMPVCQIDGKKIGIECPGAMTLKIMALFKERIMNFINS
jgi:branched-chain amino acid aminotransferase